MGGFILVTYKTRVYYEKDGPTLGAEVRIYDTDNNEIETILITSESKYRELADKILNIDDTYIDKNELINIITNTQSELQINATSLAGYSPEDFARKIHSRDTYAQTNHASSQSTYGLGTTSNYGHNKVIDNLTSTEYRNGESLSAFQGKVLSDLINSSKTDMMKWEAITLSGHDNVANYCTLQVNRSLRLANLRYVRSGVFKGVGSSNSTKNPSPYWIVGQATTGAVYLHKTGAIPSDYCPVSSIQQPTYRGDFIFRLFADGSIGMHNEDGKGNKSGNGLDIHVNLLYHY